MVTHPNSNASNARPSAGDRVNVTTGITPALEEALNERCKGLGISRASLLRQLIEHELRSSTPLLTRIEKGA